MANRHGGLTKFWADQSNCVDRNVDAGNGVQALDPETLALGPVWNNAQSVKGFDVDGYLWAVADYDKKKMRPTAPAYDIDIDTMATVDRYDRLTQPYTYSDMTGSALSNGTCPPAG